MPVSDSASSTPPTSTSPSDWPPTMLPTLTLTPAQSQGADDHTDKDKADHAALTEEGDLSGDDMSYRNDSSRIGIVGMNESLTNIHRGDDHFAVPPLSVGPDTEEEEGNEEEEAVIVAHLARWSEMDKQRRKSVRRRRPMSALVSSPDPGANAPGSAPPGLLRRLSTLRRGRGAAPANAASIPSDIEETSASATRVHSTTALAPVPTSPQPGLHSSGSSSPNSPTFLSQDTPNEAAFAGLGIASPDHQEVDMTRQPSRSDKGKSRELDRNEGNRPRPTGQRPLVTAGPAPVRSMSLRPPPREDRTRGRGRGRERSHPLSSSPSSSHSPSSASTSPSPVPSPGSRRGKADDPPRERGTWFTDFLCCMSTSSGDERQAGRTNPLE